MASKTRTYKNKNQQNKNKNKKHGGGHGASTRGRTRVALEPAPKTVFENLVPSGISNKTRRFTRARQQPAKSFWNGKIFPDMKKGFF